ncbi:Beta-glucosidase 47 [Bienertia sinuspersici]
MEYCREDFVHFAKICFENFGDRVKKWATINEPNIVAETSYINGTFPPNHCSLPFGNCSTGNSDVEPLLAVQNMLMSHAKAVKLYRDQFQVKQGGSIGIIVHAFHFEPHSDDKFGYEAVERAYAFNIAWILDPLIYGEYPALMRRYIGEDLPKFSKDEVKLVKGSLDFIGINHYSTLYAIDCFHYPHCTASENRSIRGFAGLGIYRDGYCPPNHKGVSENVLQDFKRIDYHKAYLAALVKATREGAKVQGYFAWSLLITLNGSRL